ncbi:MAG TPA: hypothetical protein VLW45_08010 [Pelomicrobium sp.]|nr:hypothetical protein [Pelomicrobium sp.]
MPLFRASRAGSRLVAALFVAASWSWAAAPPPRAVFDDWRAACLPDGSCSATTARGGGQLRVARPRADASWTITWMPRADLRAGGQLSVRVDGDPPTELAPDAGFRLLHGGRTVAVTDRRAADRLLAAMRKGREAEFSYRAGSGDPLHERFSLAGLTAALNFIAERQPPIR